MTLRNLLTADTRATEITSGISLVIIAIVIMCTGKQFFPVHLINFHAWQFWGIVSGVFGALQLTAIMLEESEHVRAVTSWIAGTYWLWSGSYQIFSGTGQFYDIVLIILGISCMYAFVINLLITTTIKNHGIDNNARPSSE